MRFAGRSIRRGAARARRGPRRARSRGMLRPRQRPLTCRIALALLAGVTSAGCADGILEIAKGSAAEFEIRISGTRDALLTGRASFYEEQPGGAFVVSMRAATGGFDLSLDAGRPSPGTIAVDEATFGLTGGPPLQLDGDAFEAVAGTVTFEAVTSVFTEGHLDLVLLHRGPQQSDSVRAVGRFRAHPAGVIVPLH